MVTQIGIVIVGDWRNTKRPLEYLILFLNTKQRIFEYQLIRINTHLDEVLGILGAESRQLVEDLQTTSPIFLGKSELKHSLDEIATALNSSMKSFDTFCRTEVPEFYIFVSPSKHTNTAFFQLDGTNGFEDDFSCKGGVILTGHHRTALAPPTVIEFVFKFIFRISIKWKFPDFTRKRRHYGQKACLFDFTDEPQYVRYMILHNFICSTCQEQIGDGLASEVLQALDASHLYAEEIDRHPAKVASKLGFNLSMTRGIYKTKFEILKDSFNASFCDKLATLCVLAFVCGIATFVGVENGLIQAMAGG